MINSVMNPLAIIGLDPGTTVGCAIIDLEGKVLKVFSGKELTLAEVISEVIKITRPLIAATDRCRLPSFVKKFSRKVGAELAIPKEDLKTEDKQEMVAELLKDKMHHNSHELDALAMAFFAYKKYLPLFNKINEFIKENQLEDKKTEFTKLAVKCDLHFALIKELVNQPTSENKIIEQVIVDNKITKKDFLKLYLQNSNLNQEKKYLQQKIFDLNKKLSGFKKINVILDKKSSHFNKKLDQLLLFKEERIKLQSQEISQREEMITKLEQDKNELYSFMAKIPAYQLVKKMDSLSKKEVEDKNLVFEIIDNDRLLVNDPNSYSEQVIAEFIKKGVKILSKNTIGSFIQNKFVTALISPEEILFENEHFALVDKELLEKKFDQKQFIERMVTEYRKERR